MSGKKIATIPMNRDKLQHEKKKTKKVDYDGN